MYVYMYTGLVYMKDLSHYSRKIGLIIMNFRTTEINYPLTRIFSFTFYLLHLIENKKIIIFSAVVKNLMFRYLKQQSWILCFGFKLFKKHWNNSSQYFLW